MSKKLNVVIWNEYRHERTEEECKRWYPDGIHAYIKDFLSVDENLDITLAALDDPQQGLPDELLNKTDVLLWWGHLAHREVDDNLVEKIRRRVYDGKMGMVVLHSGHWSKPFKQIIGATANLSWGRNQKEVIWNMMPSHPIAAGIPEHFIIEDEELYSEPFYIPQPDALVFGGWFEDGHIFRSGCCFLRGLGKVFYFQPGHESCPSYYNPYVQRIIKNAIEWAKPADIGFPVPSTGPEVIAKVTDEFQN